jgi:hypothetical protein
MANGRAGRPPKPAEPGGRTTITLRLDGQTKNLAIEMADQYGLTIAEYVEALIERDRART